MSFVARCGWNLDVSFSNVEFRVFDGSSEWVVTDDSGHLDVISTALNRFGALRSVDAVFLPVRSDGAEGCVGAEGEA